MAVDISDICCVCDFTCLMSTVKSDGHDGIG